LLLERLIFLLTYLLIAVCFRWWCQSTADCSSWSPWWRWWWWLYWQWCW